MKDRKLIGGPLDGEAFKRTAWYLDENGYALEPRRGARFEANLSGIMPKRGSPSRMMGIYAIQPGGYYLWLERNWP